ncbi:hypothetical protein STEG23_014100 [Scotinomys teguina]
MSKSSVPAQKRVTVTFFHFPVLLNSRWVESPHTEEGGCFTRCSRSHLFWKYSHRHTQKINHCGNTPTDTPGDVHRDQQRISDPPKLELQTLVSCPIWVLGPKLGSSARAVLFRTRCRFLRRPPPPPLLPHPPPPPPLTPRNPTMSDAAVDTSTEITTKDLKEKKEVVEEAENGRDAPANGNTKEENGEQEADNGEEDEEEEEGDGEEEDGDEDEEAEAPTGQAGS